MSKPTPTVSAAIAVPTSSSSGLRSSGGYVPTLSTVACEDVHLYTLSASPPTLSEVPYVLSSSPPTMFTPPSSPPTSPPSSPRSGSPPLLAKSSPLTRCYVPSAAPTPKRSFHVACIGSCCVDQVFSLENLENLNMFSRRGTDKHYLAIEISTKLNVRSVNFWPGGSASNIAVDLAKLGLSTAFFGGLGTDPPSESCMADFTQYNVDTSGVARFEEHPTGLSVILSAAGRDNGDRTVMAFKGASDHYNKSFCKEDVIRRTTILVWTSLTSDCGVEAIDHCITMARDDRIMIAGAPSISIIQNRTEDARRLVKRCHVVSMNEEEMFKLTEECDPEAAIKRILSWGSTTTVVLLTRGKQGAWLVDKRVNKIVKTTPPTGITVCDTTGAGDASMAGLLLGLVRKRTPEKCALYAVALGSLEVSTPGVRQGIPRSVTELELYIRDHPMEQDSDWWEK